MKYIDLSSQRFGRLTAVAYFTKRRNNGRVVGYWDCLCDCGKHKSVSADKLRSSNTRSCGCLRKEVVYDNNPRFLDLTGKTFGRLTVVKYSRSRGYSHYWLCHCSCGIDKIVSTGKLTTGNTQSCGCYRKSRNGELSHSFKDLRGKTFGLLSALSPITGVAIKGTQCVRWLCRCSCGEEKVIPSIDLRSGHIRSCGCLLRRTGENHPNFNKTVTEEDRRKGSRRDYFASSPQKLWERSARKRENNRCQIFERRCKTAVHHILSYARYPESRFSLDNAFVMDVKLHLLFHSRLFFGQQGTREDLLWFSALFKSMPKSVISSILDLFTIRGKYFNYSENKNKILDILRTIPDYVSRLGIQRVANVA